MAAGLAVLSGLAVAQEALTLEQLEQHIKEQRIALEEAIANREATAAQVEEVKNALDDTESRRMQIEQELEALCEEQGSLEDGSFDSCMSQSDS
ncbi:MAG: hypothetical protein AB8B87_20755 [Granulosicoccus sp.]